MITSNIYLFSFENANLFSQFQKYKSVQSYKLNQIFHSSIDQIEQLAISLLQIKIYFSIPEKISHKKNKISDIRCIKANINKEVKKGSDGEIYI